MRALRETVFASAVVLIAAAGSAEAGANFDGFLAGLDQACTRTEAFEALQTSLIAKYMPSETASAPVAVPPALASAVGPITTSDNNDHIRVMVGLDGTFKALKLAKLVFYFGKENGIYGYAVEFAEPADRLRKALGDAVTRGNKKLGKESEIGASTGLDLKNGRVAVFCDFSN